MKPNKENFEQWNEYHAEKHDLEEFYNHPNYFFRYIEQKRIKKLYSKPCRVLFVTFAIFMLDIKCCKKFIYL